MQKTMAAAKPAYNNSTRMGVAKVRTYSVGINANLGFGIFGTASVGFMWDNTGGRGLYFTKGGGVSTGLASGIGVTGGIAGGSVATQRGAEMFMGGSFGAGFGLGCDGSMDQQHHRGAECAIGGGFDLTGVIPFEGHAGFHNTSVYQLR